ncbi:MAG: FAD-binding oxidoreductase [Alphaproteobacteria bacterium]|nr:FAD-binding oxidoreductase [Alphaproteobacteria bacterium]
MEPNRIFKTVIVGRGLIGSAAARHLAKMQDGVALVGPTEPMDRAAHPGVFASHYDEGRMVRIVDPDPVWAETAKRSIDRYPEIAAESGQSFFTPSGYLGYGAVEAPSLTRSQENGQRLGAAISTLDTAEIRARYPFFSVPDDTRGLSETGTAGHVSPRGLVRAQAEAARRHGAELIDAEVRRIDGTRTGVTVETADGSLLKADRVLVAAGAFTELCGLSPRRLALRVFGRTVTLVRIDDEVGAALVGMPTVGHAGTGAYILPPIAYPDGHRYLKIGIGTTDDPEPDTAEALKDWFKSEGSQRDKVRFKAFLEDLIPVLAEARDWHTDSCAVTWTATGYPYIDFVDGDRIALAVGGNGKGAKSSDDWGWIAAHMVAKRDFDHPVTLDKLRLPQGL